VSELVIRPLEEADLPAVIAGIPSEHPEQHRRRFEGQQRSRGFVVLVAWLDDVPIGFVGVETHDDASPEEMIESRGYAHVDYLFVEPSYRRGGAGTALMEGLEERARAAGMPGMILETGTSDEFAAARALYRSLGYVNQGGVYLGGWSDPDRPGVHLVDELTIWLKRS
jgi:GNAT superfamily N-acetyltransferase